MSRSFSAFALATSLCAQGGPIYIVDAAGGPGTNYADIQAALFAVPDGSTLLVRPGTYASFMIDGKGVTILGDPSFTLGTPATALPYFVVQNTQAHQRVLVRGFAGYISFPWPVGPMVNVTNALGPVTLDGANWASNCPLTITGSPQVAVRNWSIVGHRSAALFTCWISNSGVVFELCALTGVSAWFSTASPPGQPGLTANSSHVQLVHTSVLGGQGSQAWPFPAWPGGPAISMNASSLRAIGLSNHAITGGTTPGTGQVPAITGTGVARVDPMIPLTAVPTGVAVTQVTMPALLADSAPPGGVVTARRFGAPSVLCAVALSLRAPSFTLPFLPDPIWLDPAGWFVAAAGIAPSSGPFAATLVVPNVPTLRGFQFVWQAADLDPTGIVAVSNPSPSFVR